MSLDIDLVIAKLRAGPLTGDPVFEQAADTIERLDHALDLVLQWVEAYPLDVFPEPDWKQVRALLEAGGITLDSVSAGAMRRVVDGIQRIVREAQVP